MEVRTWPIGPAKDEEGREERRWTLEEVRAYHLQSIALSLAEIAKSLRWTERALEEVNEERWIFEDALRLTQERQSVEAWFGESDTMRLSDFEQKSVSTRRIGYMRNPVQSIQKTDFLQVEPAGRGYRVRLIREDESDA